MVTDTLEMRNLLRTIRLVATLTLFGCALALSSPFKAFAEFGADSGKAEVPASMVAEYGAVADKAVEALVHGDAKAFKAMLSPGTIRMEQRGPGAIDLIIDERFIPFFQGYVKPHLVDQPFPTYRRIDNVQGVGFARSFYVKDGTEHFYVIFILKESGSLTVGNLLLDKKLSDVR
jgi:hypothetical protein